MALPLLWLLGGGAALALLAGQANKPDAPTPHNPRPDAPPPPDIDNVNQVPGRSGTIWNVETVTPRGQSADGQTATLIVWDRQMQPVLKYSDSGDKQRRLLQVYAPKGQANQAISDFGIKR